MKRKQFPEQKTECSVYLILKVAERMRKLSSMLSHLGIQKEDKVGTIAWNHHWHLEAYFAIPGAGAVLHTINIRLGPKQLAYIINQNRNYIIH